MCFFINTLNKSSKKKKVPSLGAICHATIDNEYNEYSQLLPILVLVIFSYSNGAFCKL